MPSTLPRAIPAACWCPCERQTCRALPAIAARRVQAAARRRHLQTAAGKIHTAGGESSSSSSPELKAQLLQAVSRCNNPRPGDNRLALEEAVVSSCALLAAANPERDAAQSPLLNGSWALLFSGRSRQLASQGGWPASSAAPSLQQALQRTSDSLYNFFYAYVPVLAGSAVGSSRGQAATNTQVLSPGRVDNVVETARLRLCVSGSVQRVEPTVPGGAASCVAVRFDRFTAKLGGLPEVAVSLAWLSPLGYVDTLYLDEELRVSLGDKGGLFVLRRMANR